MILVIGVMGLLITILIWGACMILNDQEDCRRAWKTYNDRVTASRTDPNRTWPPEPCCPRPSTWYVNLRKRFTDE